MNGLHLVLRYHIHNNILNAQRGAQSTMSRPPLQQATTKNDTVCSQNIIDVIYHFFLGLKRGESAGAMLEMTTVLKLLPKRSS